MLQNIVNGGNAHFNAGVAFPQQLDGILFNHNKHPFVYGKVSVPQNGHTMK